MYIRVTADGRVIASAIEALQAAKPKLTTVKAVQVLKTGIEYPLATGPTTFTPEDLKDAVESQGDPAIPAPRVWIGHEDDDRIHGARSTGIPSGEPAVGKVTNMELTQAGHTILGDVEGCPIWLANILGSAFPSRSIEGRFNFKTPTGKKWRLVISGLSLLGITWPGVGTLEDIASLYTEAGPDGLKIVEATEEAPVTVASVESRIVQGQVNVEDVRRSFYESVRNDPDRSWWWIRTMYLDPHELILDADDGDLYRMPYTVKKDKVEFGKSKKVKIKYINASSGGIVQEEINEGRAFVARFDSRAESRPEGLGGVLEVKVPLARTVHINVKRGASQ